MDKDFLGVFAEVNFLHCGLLGRCAPFNGSVQRLGMRLLLHRISVRKLQTAQSC